LIDLLLITFLLLEM